MKTAAETAKAIKAELKSKFPKTKFSVRSSNFSGGNSVDIDWVDGPTTENVNKVVKKYQYGHFNGMEDIFEYSNTRTDIPQAKYIMTCREVSQCHKDAVKAKIAADFAVDMDDQAAVFDIFNQWPDSVIGRELSKMEF
jgi:acyl-CoA hydrolase